MTLQEFFKAKRKLGTLKKPKYNNQKIEIDGVKFDSKAESARAGQLKILEKQKHIKDLEFQKDFTLLSIVVRKEIKGEDLKLSNFNKKTQQVKYKADFFYFDNRINKYVIEDLKSIATAKDKTYIIKRKLMLMELKKKEIFKDTIFREYIINRKELPVIIDWKTK